MKNYIFYLLFILFSFQSTNAQWWSSNEKIRGNGEMVSETRNLSDYETVAVSGSFEVELISGNEGDIKISAESNLMEHIVTEVSNGKLIIKTEKGYNLNPTEEIKITVPFKSISGVALSGSGEIISRDRINSGNFNFALSGSGLVQLNLEAENVNGAMSGSGDIKLSGTTDEFEMALSGSGDVEAFEFKADNVEATISGSGDIEVYASEILEARVSGSGDIVYKGNPAKEDFRTSGSGSVSKE